MEASNLLKIAFELAQEAGMMPMVAATTNWWAPTLEMGSSKTTRSLNFSLGTKQWHHSIKKKQRRDYGDTPCANANPDYLYLIRNQGNWPASPLACLNHMCALEAVKTPTCQTRTHTHERKLSTGFFVCAAETKTTITRPIQRSPPPSPTHD